MLLAHQDQPGIGPVSRQPRKRLDNAADALVMFQKTENAEERLAVKFQTPPRRRPIHQRSRHAVRDHGNRQRVTILAHQFLT